MKTLLYVLVIFITGLLLIKSHPKYERRPLPKHHLRDTYEEGEANVLHSENKVDSTIIMLEKNIEYFKNIEQ